MSTVVKPFTGHKERLSGSLGGKASKETEKIMSRRSASSPSIASTLSRPFYKEMILSEETETTMSGSSVSQSTS
ncbi:hypothetical protein GBAR_LOCUS19850, partial [Geodia barretti]